MMMCKMQDREGKRKENKKQGRGRHRIRGAGEALRLFENRQNRVRGSQKMAQNRAQNGPFLGFKNPYPPDRKNGLGPLF